MTHPARWAALAVGVVMVALAVVLATQVSTDPRQDAKSSRLVGHAEPSFTVHTFNGQTLSSKNLVGKTVIVNFWNSWCPPCQRELPSLRAFQQRHAGDPNVVLLGIVRDDTVGAARAYANAEGMTWALAADGDSSLSLAFGTRGQPETYAISPRGLVVGSQFGATSVTDLEQLLAAAQGTA